MGSSYGEIHNTKKSDPKREVRFFFFFFVFFFGGGEGAAASSFLFGASGKFGSFLKCANIAIIYCWLTL